MKKENFDRQTIKDFFRNIYESILDEYETINEDEVQDAQEDQNEADVVGGVTTPLGTGPNYPNTPSKKSIPPWKAAAAAYADARLAKIKNKKLKK